MKVASFFRISILAYPLSHGFLKVYRWDILHALSKGVVPINVLTNEIFNRFVPSFVFNNVYANQNCLPGL
jgi:hypothetical protein